MYNVIIIGAGVPGAAPAREPSQYKVNACVPEREENMCRGTSKANNAIVHAGYDMAEGSLMARLNVEGNQIMLELAGGLDSPFNPCGSSVVCLDEESLPSLRVLYERGVKNGVKDLEIIMDKAKIKEMKPSLADEMAGVLYAPTVDIVYPSNLNITLAENTYTNGVDSKFNTEVTDIHRIEDGWALETNQGVYGTRYVVNAVGAYADKFHSMVSGIKIHITPRREGYCLLDRSAGNHVSRTMPAPPGKYRKGVLIFPTVHGSLIMGLTVIDIENKEVITTTGERLDELIAETGMNVRDLLMRQVITSFTGLRAYEDHHESIIKELEDVPGFADCAGIKPPGLTSCPAIGRMVAGILKEKLELEPSMQSNSSRKGILGPDTPTKKEQTELIKQNPTYGNTICCCKAVTEGETLDTTHKPLGARSLDGIKHRTRTGVGRCQAGFCTPRSTELLHYELGLPTTEVTEASGDSKLVVGTNKDRIQKGARAR